MLITNIGSMHIENLGSREGILKAKLEILEGLHPGGTAMFNGDEPLLWNLRERPVCKTMYFGIENQDCDVRGVDIELKEGCSQFRIVGLGHDFPVTCRSAAFTMSTMPLAPLPLRCSMTCPSRTFRRPWPPM